MSASLDRLRALGAISSLDAHFARGLGHMAGGEPESEVLLAVAMVSRHVGEGHVCLDLPRTVSQETLAEFVERVAGEPLADAVWPPLEAWLTALRASPLVEYVEARAAAGVDGAGGGEAVRPLVLDASGRLYLRRYWEHQRQLATILLGLAEDAAEPVDEGVLAEGLARLFDAAGPDHQRDAAERAVRERLCVVAGGPGTGKTSTVVKIMALLVEQAAAGGRPPPSISLVAPTGKAAAALADAVARSVDSLACDEAVRAAIPRVATTIHRALGVRRGEGARFRHGPGHPLSCEVLLVDEASMVDLALMARLCGALRPGARLILLGDRDQLASVEAGAVLGDICNVDALPATDSVTGTGGGLAGRVVSLTRSYRYAAEGGIGALARAINRGDVPAVLALLRDPGSPELRLLEPGADDPPGSALAQSVRRGYEPYLLALTRESPARRLAALSRYRVLCAHRRGPGGVEEINRAIERVLADAGGLDPGDAGDRQRGLPYAGQPIMVTRNDYELGLYNGDVGIYAPAPGGADGPLRACFLAADGSPRWLSPARLRQPETVFAMSVHKSQGSEFETVALVLPERVSPILTRELIYTAVSRARVGVEIHASAEVLARAIEQRVERASGLREMLWPEAASAS